MNALCRLWSAGMLKPPGQRLHPLDDVVAAMAVVARREAIGKVLLAIEPRPRGGAA
jgi:hypothetical protein